MVGNITVVKPDPVDGALHAPPAAEMDPDVSPIPTQRPKGRPHAETALRGALTLIDETRQTSNGLHGG